MQMEKDRPSERSFEMLKNQPQELNWMRASGLVDWNQRGAAIYWRSMQSDRVLDNHPIAARGRSIVWVKAGGCSEIWMDGPWSRSFCFNVKFFASMVKDHCHWRAFRRRLFFFEITCWNPSTSVGGGCWSKGCGRERGGCPRIEFVERQRW